MFSEGQKNLLWHDFHTSIAEVDYNDRSKSLEISLRVFTDDLELALSRLGQLEGLRLDHSKKHHPLIERYLARYFYVSDPKSQKLSFVFHGKEMEADVTWIYFEIPTKKLPKDINWSMPYLPKCMMTR
ncbi:MAG: hypothetical protein HC880_15480 [Bacteroidia bacterium]|nr:hypothetical protein [Bacteroidia bacterium]